MKKSVNPLPLTAVFSLFSAILGGFFLRIVVNSNFLILELCAAILVGSFTFCALTRLFPILRINLIAIFLYFAAAISSQFFALVSLIPIYFDVQRLVARWSVGGAGLAFLNLTSETPISLQIMAVVFVGCVIYLCKKILVPGALVTLVMAGIAGIALNSYQQKSDVIPEMSPQLASAIKTLKTIRQYQRYLSAAEQQSARENVEAQIVPLLVNEVKLSNLDRGVIYWCLQSNLPCHDLERQISDFRQLLPSSIALPRFRSLAIEKCPDLPLKLIPLITGVSAVTEFSFGRKGTPAEECPKLFEPRLLLSLFPDLRGVTLISPSIAQIQAVPNEVGRIKIISAVLEQDILDALFKRDGLIEVSLSVKKNLIANFDLLRNQATLKILSLAGAGISNELLATLPELRLELLELGPSENLALFGLRGLSRVQAETMRIKSATLSESMVASTLRRLEYPPKKIEFVPLKPPEIPSHAPEELRTDILKRWHESLSW